MIRTNKTVSVDATSAILVDRWICELCRIKSGKNFILVLTRIPLYRYQDSVGKPISGHEYIAGIEGIVIVCAKGLWEVSDQSVVIS